MTLLHTDIPSGQSDRYRSRWNELYLSRMKAYFSEATGEAEAAAKPPARKSSAEKEPMKRAAPKHAKAPAKARKVRKVRKARKARKVPQTAKRSAKAGARKTKKSTPKASKKSPKVPKKSSKVRAGRRKKRK